MKRWVRLRWQVRMLGVIDFLLGTHLVNEATRRWLQELEAMQTEIISLQTDLEELNVSRATILRQLCLSYLQLRQLHDPTGWLHFDPQTSTEESAIDVLTRALVSPHWARWRITQIRTEDDTRYVYDMVPDWKALHQDALNHAANFPSSLIDWLHEQLEQQPKQSK